MLATLDSSNDHFQGPNNSIRLVMQPTKIANLLIYSSLSLLGLWAYSSHQTPQLNK